MGNCKFGLNEHKPFLGNKEKNHHNHETNKLNFKGGF